jgi:hypothetical protein
LRGDRNKTSAIEFIRYAKDTQELVRKKGWHLETKFNRHYCSFKLGFFNAFGVQWIGSKTFAMFVKLPESGSVSHRTKDDEIRNTVEANRLLHRAR